MVDVWQRGRLRATLQRRTHPGGYTDALPIDRPQDALNECVEFRQCFELFGQIAMPIIDALDAP
jgi:hypothetical protein